MLIVYLCTFPFASVFYISRLHYVHIFQHLLYHNISRVSCPRCIRTVHTKLAQPSSQRGPLTEACILPLDRDIHRHALKSPTIRSGHSPVLSILVTLHGTAMAIYWIGHSGTGQQLKKYIRKPGEKWKSKKNGSKNSSKLYQKEWRKIISFYIYVQHTYMQCKVIQWK